MISCITNVIFGYICRNGSSEFVQEEKLHVTINALLVYLRMLFVVYAASYAYVSIVVRKLGRPISPLVIRVYKQVLKYLFALVYESDVICN